MTIDFDWLDERILLRKSDADERKLLASIMKSGHYAEGDMIVAQGAAGGKLYLLREGVADITCLSEGETVRIATAKEGSLFGEMTFLTGEAASATVTARTACTVYELDRGGYSELMQKNQDMVYALFAYMLVHSASVIRRMNEEHVSLMHYITGRRV